MSFRGSDATVGIRPPKDPFFTKLSKKIQHLENGLPHQRARWFAMTCFFDSLTAGADARIGPSRSAVVVWAERGDVGIAPYGIRGAVIYTDIQ